MSKNYRNYSNFSKETIEEPKETIEEPKETIEKVKDPVYGIVKVALNFRNAPCFNADIIEVLQKGDKLLVYSSDKGWLKVWFNGKDGFVKEEFVEEA